MTERLLHFIWQFQYFNQSELTTSAGEDLQVVFPGSYNTNQGPDFTNARVRIGNTIWAGTVELHLRTSDWNRHRHQQDANYENVVLHVVWENDGKVNDLPLLELQQRVPKILLDQYGEWMRSASFIPCESSLHLVPALIWTHWKERLIMERLIRKAGLVEQYQVQNNNHWEETFWWMLARNFGLKVNADSFEAVARSIPLRLLARHKSRIQQLEAILLGQAGLLDGRFQDDYALLLQREYRFLRGKHNLRSVPAPMHFLRMRPSNFPSLRLAQLAMLVHQSGHLFSRIREAASVEQVRALLDVTANDYWHYHYRLDQYSPFRVKKLGKDMIDNILINTVAPVLFAYGRYQQEDGLMQRVLEWLEQIPPEGNRIIARYARLGVVNRSAWDSQSLLELYSAYCQPRKCLECAIGAAILGRIQ